MPTLPYTTLAHPTYPPPPQALNLRLAKPTQPAFYLQQMDEQIGDRQANDTTLMLVGILLVW